MPKRPMGFPNPNFVQGQVSASAPGTPGGGAGQQLQSSQAMTHTGKRLAVHIIINIFGKDPLLHVPVLRYLHLKNKLSCFMICSLTDEN